MAIGAVVPRFRFRGRSLWLIVIEIVEPPPISISVALGILDSHIGAIERPGEIAAPRKLGPWTVGVLPRQRELQLLEHDRSSDQGNRSRVSRAGVRRDV